MSASAATSTRSSSLVSCLSNKRAEFKRLVFFDCSTPGLYQDVRDFELVDSRDPSAFSDHMKAFMDNFDPLKFSPIAEMSLVSITRDVFEANIAAMERLFEMMETRDPTDREPLEVRMGLDVLTLTMDVNISAQKIYELRAKFGDDSPLRHHEAIERKFATRDRATFAQKWRLIHLYLELLPKPAVMIAHNGIYHDFRALFGELRRYELLSQGLPDGLYFADSMFGIINIERRIFAAIDSSLDLESFEGNPWSTLKSRTPSVGLKKRLGDENFQRWFGRWRLSIKRWERYKLDTIYGTIIKGSRVLHWSQNDSEALLQVALAYGHLFIDYLEQASAPFPF